MSDMPFSGFEGVYVGESMTYMEDNLSIEGPNKIFPIFFTYNNLEI